MAQTNNNSFASSLHTLVDWIQARLNERESWDGVTLVILSLLILMVSSFIVYIAWAGVAYGAWIVWKKGSWKQPPARERDK